MTIGQLREQITQIGIGLDAVHLACADQAGEAGPVPAALIVTREECVSAVRDWASDGVFDKVRVDVDTPVLQKQPKAILALQHVGHGLANIAILRRRALDLARRDTSKGSLSIKLKRAGWNDAFPLSLLNKLANT